MKHLDLFSGIGGFSLAADWVWGKENVEHIFCEIEEFPQKILMKHWPESELYYDITQLDGSDIAHVYIVTGGYPCQAHSTAARGRNNAPCLSSDFVRIIRNVMPRYVIGENVQRKAVEGVKRELEALGYNAFIQCIGSSQLGYDHQRNRWWVIAHTYNDGKLQSAIDAKVEELQELQNDYRGAEDFSRVVRVSDELPNRTHRLKSLGNSIDPKVAAAIMQAIKEIDNG